MPFRADDALGVHEQSLLANAHVGYLDAVQGALARGADVNAQDANGRTALMLAADFRRTLLMPISDISMNMTGKTSDELARLLVGSGLTHDATRGGGNGEVLQALLQKKNNLNAHDKDGRTALIYAARAANTIALRLLLEKRPEVNTRDRAGLTALDYAAGNNDVEGVQALMAAGSTLDAHSADGPIMLHYAIRQQDNVQVRALLAQGVAATGEGRLSPLMAAAFSNNAGAIELLVEHGVNLNTLDIKWSFGIETPLGMALTFRNERAAELLLRQGADPNGTFVSGRSCFLQASMLGSVQLLRTFVDKGGDVNTHDDQGSTPLLEVLFGFSHADSAADNGALMRSGKHETNTFTIVKMLLDKGADINARNKEGKTVLLIAIQSAQFDIAHYLIEHGANVNTKTSKGVTPLSLAVAFHQDVLVAALRAAGARE